MKPPPFHYHRPEAADEAIALLAELAPHEGRVLAGGQSLIPAMALRLARPAHLVDINRVAGFGRLEQRDGMLRIGPCVRHAAPWSDAAPGPLGRLLNQVRKHIAHDPIRRRGTFCGSLANADPASEWCLLAATLGAEMVASSVRGSRTIGAAGFFAGIMATALAPDELLAEVRLPVLPTDTYVGFYEFSRRAGDFAQVMALAGFRLRDGVIAAPLVGLGAVEDRPRRLPEVEAVLTGQPPSVALFARAAASIRSLLLPLDPDPYRLDLAEAAVRRALADAAGSSA
jgi:carbon-monoxide dehydrogenase medium subunit